MKWTAYYNAKNLFTNEVERVYLGKSFKTKMAKYNMRQKSAETIYLVKE